MQRDKDSTSDHNVFVRLIHIDGLVLEMCNSIANALQ